MESLNLFQRINQVMKKVNYVQKEDKKVNGQYTFVSHDAVTRLLHGPCTEAGIAVMPSVVEYLQDGNRTTVWVEVTLVNIDKPTEMFSVKSIGYGIDAQDKGPGKAFSYAFKMCLLKLFMLESGEEDVEIKNVDYKPELPKGDVLKAKNMIKSAPSMSDLTKIKQNLNLRSWTDQEFEELTACIANKNIELTFQE